VLLRVAFRVAVCAVLTAKATAWKLALVAPAAIVTDDGTVSAVTLLDRITVSPPVGAAAFSVTVQESIAAPVSEPLEQLSPLSTGCPVPLKAIVEVVPADELLVRVTVPLTAPAAVGSKLIASVAVAPAFSVNGKLTPESLKPLPLTVPALTVTASVPDEVSVTDWEVVDATFTVPKLTLLALSFSAGVPAAVRLIG
jgi:hypothetical protein